MSEQISNEDTQSQGEKYTNTRRRYYALNRDRILEQSKSAMKRRYAEDAEYRERTKALAKARYISKKQQADSGEKHQKIKNLYIQIDEAKKQYKEQLEQLHKDHQQRLSQLQHDIDQIRSAL